MAALNVERVTSFNSLVCVGRMPFGGHVPDAIEILSGPEILKRFGKFTVGRWGRTVEVRLANPRAAKTAYPSTAAGPNSASPNCEP